MVAYVLRRLVQVPLVLIVVSLTIFIIVRATPGDPVQIMLGMQTSPEAEAALRQVFRLDRPVAEQYVLWVFDVVRGDLGNSIRLNQPVADLLMERFPISLKLAFASIAFAIALSVPLGVAAALWRNSWVDYLCTGFTLIGFSVPNFALALILIFIFSIQLEWFPITGIGSGTPGSWQEAALPYVLPSISLGILQVAVLTRLLRSSMIDVLSQDYIRTAHAKGLLPVTVIVVHGLRNALIPFVTMVVIQFGFLVGIQVTIEYIFAIPGMGSAMLSAVVNRDFPVIQGFTLVIAMFFLLANIFADVMYSILDPRIRL
jgi:peptide/nickel transport system permease protein